MSPPAVAVAAVFSFVFTSAGGSRFLVARFENGRAALGRASRHWGHGAWDGRVKAAVCRAVRRRRPGPARRNVLPWCRAAPRGMGWPRTVRGGLGGRQQQRPRLGLVGSGRGGGGPCGAHVTERRVSLRGPCRAGGARAPTRCVRRVSTNAPAEIELRQRGLGEAQLSSAQLSQARWQRASADVASADRPGRARRPTVSTCAVCRTRLYHTRCPALSVSVTWLVCGTATTSGATRRAAWAVPPHRDRGVCLGFVEPKNQPSSKQMEDDDGWHGRHDLAVEMVRAPWGARGTCVL